jgi:hypothetical protein
MRIRAGAVSVAELILVATLFGVVLAGVARFAAAQSRAAAVQQDRLRLEEAVRTAVVILGAELRVLATGDVGAAGPDSVRLRAFRGAGAVCRQEEGRLVLRYAGLRLPDPDRDSVVVITADSEYALAFLAAHRVEECDRGVAITLHAQPSGVPALALVFETGAYSVGDGAVRYRRGAGGRQPLTEAVLRDMALELYGEGLVLGLAPEPDSLRRLSATRIRVPLAMLNLESAGASP